MQKAQWLFVCLGAASLISGQTMVDLRTQSKSVDFSGANTTKPFKSGTILPANCSVGEMFFKTDAPSGVNLYGCTALNSWAIQSGGSVPSAFGNAGKALASDGANLVWTSLGGDVVGPINSTLVTQLQSRQVASNTPVNGNFLGWSGTNNRWEPMTPSTGGGAGIPAVAGNAGKFFTNDGSSTLWSTPSGDITGALGSVVVTGLQGRTVASTSPSSGQVLSWNSSTVRWEPQTVSGTGTGASTASQLGDFSVTRTSATTLTVGASCSPATPCNVRFGSLNYSFTSGATISQGGGSGFVYVYISSSGTLTAGHNFTVSCPGGCVAQSGVTSFPADSIPIFTWSATNNAWDPTGLDQRAFLATKDILAGPGINTTEVQGNTVIAADPSVVSLRVGVPPTAASACSAGGWATDGFFYYLCVSANTWRRAALGAW